MNPTERRRMSLSDVKDAIDEILAPRGPRTSPRLRAMLTKARDLADYIQVTHIDTLELDLEERQKELR